MANDEVSLAGAALAIALVALLTALGQLLGQYFSTADGYRRCQQSVMGDYAKKTRRVWRWREFRFETLYTTPEIFLTGDGAPIRALQILVTGSQLSRTQSLIPLSSGDDQNVVLLDEQHSGWISKMDGEVSQMANPEALGLYMANIDDMDIQSASFSDASSHQGEMASWIPFLHWVHEVTGESLGDYQKMNNQQMRKGNRFPPPTTRIPAIIFRERSWDFQPPDVVRPFAKITLSDIAVIARRMGMKWKEFRPSDGVLRAEGHSHIITSTVVRSLGIVLQYSFTGRGRRLQVAERNHKGRQIAGSTITEYPEIYIPRARSDRLGCGVIRSDGKLGLPDFTVSTQSEIATALSFLDRSGTSSTALKRILKQNPEFKFRVADLVAFTTKEVRSRGSDLVQIPAPSDNVHGVTMSPIGRRAFRQCLEEYIVMHHRDVGIRTQEALQICNRIGSQFGAWDHTDEFSVDEEEWVVTRDMRYLDAVQDILWSLTDLLNEMENQHSHFRYLNLLGIHIKVAMFAEEGETSTLRSWENDYKADMDGYFRQIPKIVDEMRKTGFYDRQLIVDAWITMMLRGMCWGALHFFVPGERVPILYFGSQLPVYIG